MAPISTISANPSSSEVLQRVTSEFSGFLSKIEALEAEKSKLSEDLSKAKAAAAELKPELLAKLYVDSKALAKQEADLLSQRKNHLLKFEKAKAAFDNAQHDFSQYEKAFKEISSRAENHSALLFAKMDAYVTDLKVRKEKEFEVALSEKTKASTERQAADDLLKKANDQLQKVSDNGKAVLDKIAKAERESEIKLKALTEQVASAQKEKTRLEKDVQYLRDLYEKRKHLEEGLQGKKS